MERKITKIPASLKKISSDDSSNQEKKRVAGYARVSTDSDEQLTSYEAQRDYYTNYIKKHADWEFAGMYSDEGRSGTNTKHRDGFNKMIENALAGKIDLILTKSVSRFARNTVDSLTTIRELKEHGVEVYFEKENIWTLDSKGELLITIMSSLAQEESRSISENVKWGKRKDFANGHVYLAYSRFLGYDKGLDGKMVVNPEEAKIVKDIFSYYLAGDSYSTIARKLTERGIKTPGGKDKWSVSTISSILRNEKYKGDALLQKVYSEDFISKKLVKNDGTIPQYYVEGDHEAIISPETFDRVQLEIQRRSHMSNKYSGISAFSSKIKCGECGGWYGPKIWHSNDKYRRVVWQCNNRYKNKEKKCNTPHVTEHEIKDLFIKVANKLIRKRKTLMSDLDEGIAIISDTQELEASRDDIKRSIDTMTEQAQAMIRENSTKKLDQEEFRKRYSDLEDKIDQAKKQLTSVETKIHDKKTTKEDLLHFKEEIGKRSELITEFDLGLWHAIVDHVTVYNKEDIRFTLTDGREVKA
ncbi:MAG: recombinase family protein [Candidatus Weimeria sp.]